MEKSVEEILFSPTMGRNRYPYTSTFLPIPPSPDTPYIEISYFIPNSTSLGLAEMTVWGFGKNFSTRMPPMVDDMHVRNIAKIGHTLSGS